MPDRFRIGCENGHECRPWGDMFAWRGRHCDRPLNLTFSRPRNALGIALGAEPHLALVAIRLPTLPVYLGDVQHLAGLVVMHCDSRRARPLAARHSRREMIFKKYLAKPHFGNITITNDKIYFQY